MNNRYESNTDLTAQFLPPKAHPISAFFDNIEDDSNEDKSSNESSEGAMEQDNSDMESSDSGEEMEP